MAGSRRNTSRFAPLAALGLCVALAGCNSRPSQQPVGGASNGKADKARKDAEALAVNSVIAGAEAQAKAGAREGVAINVIVAPDGSGAAKAAAGAPIPGTPAGASAAPGSVLVAKGPAPKSPPRPGAPAVVRERVASTIPYPTEAEAEDDALAQARDVVEQKLAALDPPVRHKPTIGEVKTEFVRKDSRTVRPLTASEKEAFASYGETGNLVYVEYDVEVSADQVREMRSQERVSAGIRILGMLVAVSLAGFLFLRADEWTKGYLTRWLAFAAVLLAGGAAAAFLFI